MLRSISEIAKLHSASPDLTTFKTRLKTINQGIVEVTERKPELEQMAQTGEIRVLSKEGVLIRTTAEAMQSLLLAMYAFEDGYVAGHRSQNPYGYQIIQLLNKISFQETQSKSGIDENIKFFSSMILLFETVQSLKLFESLSTFATSKDQFISLLVEFGLIQ
jgi:hypothetical protein